MGRGAPKERAKLPKCCVKGCGVNSRGEWFGPLADVGGPCPTHTNAGEAGKELKPGAVWNDPERAPQQYTGARALVLQPDGVRVNKTATAEAGRLAEAQRSAARAAPEAARRLEVATAEQQRHPSAKMSLEDARRGMRSLNETLEEDDAFAYVGNAGLEQLFVEAPLRAFEYYCSYVIVFFFVHHRYGLPLLPKLGKDEGNGDVDGMELESHFVEYAADELSTSRHPYDRELCWGTGAPTSVPLLDSRMVIGRVGTKERASALRGGGPHCNRYDDQDAVVSFAAVGTELSALAHYSFRRSQLPAGGLRDGNGAVVKYVRVESLDDIRAAIRQGAARLSVRACIDLAVLEHELGIFVNSAKLALENVRWEALQGRLVRERRGRDRLAGHWGPTRISETAALMADLNACEEEKEAGDDGLWEVEAGLYHEDAAGAKRALTRYKDAHRKEKPSKKSKRSGIKKKSTKKSKR